MGTTFVVQHPTNAALRALNYTPEVEALRRRKGKCQNLGELLSEIGPAYGSVFVRIDCDPSEGVELITQGDMFAAEVQGRVIRRDSMSRPERHHVKRWQVLIAGAGTLGENELYGRSIIADNRLAGRYVGPHAMVLSFKEPGSIENLFVYAFLCSRVGIRALRSASYGTKILGIRKDLLADLPVPEAEPEQKERVATLIRRCVEGRETYLRELQAARRIIEDLPEMREAHAMCAERKARCIVWDGELPSVSAWNYASTGGALETLGRSWSARLGDILEPDGLFYGLLRQRTPCRPGCGIALITQRDALSLRQLPSWIADPGVPRRALFSPPHSIAMAGRGTLGEGEIFARPVYISPYLSRYALTQDLLRMVPKNEYVALAYSYLSTLVGRRLLRSAGVGTKILQLRLDLIRSLPCPELSKHHATELIKRHAAAIEAFDSSLQSESEAIRIIEEEVLPAWLA